MTRLLPIITTLLFIALMLIGGLVWWPKLQEFLVVKAELKIKEAELLQKQEYFSKLEKISQQLANYKSEIKRIETALPERPFQPRLLNFVQRIALENDLILQKINSIKTSTSQKTKKSKTKLPEIIYDITLVGPYDGFKGFLSEIYQNSRLIEVRSINFSQKSEGSEIFEYNVELTAHYLSENSL